MFLHYVSLAVLTFISHNNPHLFSSFLIDSSLPRTSSVHSVVSMIEHANKRRNWDSAFSVSALKGYEECLARNVEMAISQVSKLGKDQNPVAVNEVISWFGFDVMGEIGFGKSFGNLENDKTVEAVKVSGVDSFSRGKSEATKFL